MSFLMLPIYYASDDQSSIPASESSIETIEKPYQLYAKNQIPEKCLVCENLAIGYHYGVPSCNGCKTFFRRTIINGKRYICTNKLNCLDKKGQMEEKRMCKACRFSRCIEVGMDPTHVKAAVKTLEGKYLLDEIIRISMRKNGIQKTVSSKNKFSTIIDRLTRIEEKSELFHGSPIPKGYEDLRTLAEILDVGPIFSYDSIRDLTIADGNTSLRSCMKYMNSGILTNIEVLKTFRFSSKLNLTSKKVLMTHSAPIGSIMMSASFSMHHKKSDQLLLPDGSVYGRVVGCMTGILLTDYQKQLQKTLQAFLRNRVDRVEYILLKAILMSNPAIPGISVEDQQIIEIERNEYAKALLDYCIFQNGISHGPARFGALLSINPIIEMQSKKQKDIYILMKALSRQQSCKFPKCLYDDVMDS